MKDNENLKEYTYLILGAGRQGTAAAYDLAKYGQAQKIIIADKDPAKAQYAAARINRLLEREIATAQHLDAANQDAVYSAMLAADAVLSAIPYFLNYDLSVMAIKTQIHYCDMGGNTEIVRRQLGLNDEARQAQISIVPDCGMGPGLINTMAAFALDIFEGIDEIIIYDAGLPQEMKAPWYYQSTFNLNGLTNEMSGKAVVLREGKVQRIDTLCEPELVEIPGFAALEADHISGGASTAPWSFQGRLKSYENKTLRHPKHWEWMRAYKALGLFSEDPIHVENQTLIPRHVFHTLLGPHINAADIRDVAIIRIKASGTKDGIEQVQYIDLIDYYDEKTGFTAMERLTGWHCAITMGFQVRGMIKPGAWPIETAIDPKLFMQAIEERGIHFKIHGVQ